MSVEVKLNISNALKAFSSGNFSKNALKLFDVLGYNTERQAPLDNPTFKGFKETFIHSSTKFDEAKAFAQEWKSVDLLFQLSKEEILKQLSFFDNKKVDRTIIETYLFFSIELSREQCTRTELAHITREVNRVFSMPVMILFKHGNTLTFSAINRRLHKRDESKDVLEKVTLIKDIIIDNPHRGHIEILFDLSFNELKTKHNFTNFVELHNAWQQTFDLKLLNKKFFDELANWYFRATQMVSFPDDEIKDSNVRNATGVIRLITRVMFVWFLKEKSLVPDDLFDEKKIKQLLKSDKSKNNTYYKAILQNLFFATLNTEMGKRKFRTTPDKSQSNHFFIHNLFRYKDYFVNPQETLEKYFDPIPFLNGGLFECLDKEIEIENGKIDRIRIDGFSDRTDNVLNVPDELFFNENGTTVNLSEIYGSPKKSKEKVRGLIDILNSYKFTITENTPVEEEVALDPELLGKVFENLLANFNPETQTTARKQTGSFYTPREIVNYMVDESLIAYLLQNLQGLNHEERLRDLLSYSEKENTFTDSEKVTLINAIDNIKIIDPACGSGAFPMGILHKLVHILHKLDPKNERWKQLQIDKAEKIDDPRIREDAITKIENAFQNNELDYGRKLYLIENCIFGVDIQSIAAQISKLRFFIALIVDQNVNRDNPKNNYDIEPLPNLETKFVAANTLIELENEKEDLFSNEELKKKKEKLKDVRHNYFKARTPQKKRKCREDDKQLREEMAVIIKEELIHHNNSLKSQIKQQEKMIELLEKELKKDKLKDDKKEKIKKDLKKQMDKLADLQSHLTDNKTIEQTAHKLSSWDPYNQNASASFFDTEWMFGIKEGFDIVIGNPPYVEAKKLKDVSQILRNIYTTYSGTADLYVYFYENGVKLLRENGTLVFITSNKFIKTSYGENLRKYFTGFKINEIIDFTDVHVFEALVASCIFSISKANVGNNKIRIAFANDTLTDFAEITDFIEQNKFYLSQNGLNEQIWQLENETNLALKDKIESGSITLNQTKTVQIFRGITTGYNPAFIINDEKKRDLIKDEKANENVIKPLLQGRNIRKWVYNKSGEHLLFIPWHFPLQLDNSISGSSIKAENAFKKSYPILFDHLINYKSELSARNKEETGIRYEWFALQRCAASYYPEFEKEKIIWGLTSDKWTFAYDNENHFLPSNGYILTSSQIPIKYLLALMNSKVMEFYFGFIGIMTAGGAFTQKYETVIEFPIKIVSNKSQLPFITLVDKILSLKAKHQNTDELEQEIDVMVYKLYDLTWDEVLVIDKDFGMSREEYNKKD